MEPQPATVFNDNIVDNSQHYYASIMKSFHHAASSYDYFFSSKTSCFNDFENSIIHGDKDIFDKLYYSNDENRTLRYKWTPIMISGWSMNNIFFYHLLNNYNVDLDIKNDRGQTVLHIVCIRKACEFIDVLIQHGAHIDIKDDYGYTPLQYLNNYPINIDKIKELYKTEQAWITRKYLFLIHHYINKNFNKLCISGKKVLQYSDLVRYISSFL